uniref:Uncharacterized protein n=1 Tax=Glossina pallidipes TaxID=7398 RepID=A0A1A9ZX96_GLOPL
MVINLLNNNSDSVHEGTAFHNFVGSQLMVASPIADGNVYPCTTATTSTTILYYTILYFTSTILYYTILHYTSTIPALLRYINPNALRTRASTFPVRMNALTCKCASLNTAKKNVLRSSDLLVQELQSFYCCGYQ